MDHELIAEWFQYADVDLTTAEHLSNTMRPQPLEIICFLCQQSAEKNLKGYLIIKGIAEPPKTHDLRILRKMCLDFDAGYDTIERACNALTRYGVQPRYPNELGIIENDMKRALEYARLIRSFEPLVKARRENDQP
jgi:HEPN domain-containing protein